MFARRAMECKDPIYQGSDRQVSQLDIHRTPITARGPLKALPHSAHLESLTAAWLVGSNGTDASPRSIEDRRAASVLLLPAATSSAASWLPRRAAFTRPEHPVLRHSMSRCTTCSRSSKEKVMLAKMVLKAWLHWKRNPNHCWGMAQDGCVCTHAKHAKHVNWQHAVEEQLPLVQ